MLEIVSFYHCLWLKLLLRICKSMRWTIYLDAYLFMTYTSFRVQPKKPYYFIERFEAISLIRVYKARQILLVWKEIAFALIFSICSTERNYKNLIKNLSAIRKIRVHADILIDWVDCEQFRFKQMPRRIGIVYRSQIHVFYAANK